MVTGGSMLGVVWQDRRADEGDTVHFCTIHDDHINNFCAMGGLGDNLDEFGKTL